LDTSTNVNVTVFVLTEPWLIENPPFAKGATYPAEPLEWLTSFRYTYGRPVKGKLEVKIRIIGSDYYSHTTGPIVRKSGEVGGRRSIQLVGQTHW